MVTMRRRPEALSGRWFGLGVVLAALAAAPAVAGAATWREESDQTIPLEGITSLRIENARGEVDVRPGPAGSIRVTALKTARARTEARAKDLAGRTTVETRREGGRFEIVVKYPQRNAIRIGWRELVRGSVDSPQSEVRLTLQIPRELALEMRSASADLSALDLAGPLEIDTASGDVTVIGTRGAVDVATSAGSIEAKDVRGLNARTVSGSVRVENASGALHARSTSGTITVRGATDSISVRSVSGDIHVAEAPLGLTASTSSGSIDARGVARRAALTAAAGDIDVSFIAPLAGAEVSTVSGRIVGRLAAGLGCRVDMRTSGGDLEVLLPIELKSVSRREIVGVVNRGKAPVALQTSAGDIELSAEVSRP
jgi:DUF4097 and DUF4098 domain-containing protein YvlB